MLQPLFGQTRSHSFGKELEGERVTNGHSIYVSKLKSGTVLIFVPTVPFVPQITQKAKNCKEKFRLQRRSGSEERDKRPQIGRKNDKRTQIGKMPIARRSSAGWLGERFDVNFSVCLLHAALPEILLPASSLQAAPARIGHRPNVLEEQFFC